MEPVVRTDPHRVPAQQDKAEMKDPLVTGAHGLARRRSLILR